MELPSTSCMKTGTISLRECWTCKFTANRAPKPPRFHHFAASSRTNTTIHFLSFRDPNPKTEGDPNQNKPLLGCGQSDGSQQRPGGPLEDAARAQPQPPPSGAPGQAQNSESGHRPEARGKGAQRGAAVQDQGAQHWEGREAGRERSEGSAPD